MLTSLLSETVLLLVVGIESTLDLTGAGGGVFSAILKMRSPAMNIGALSFTSSMVTVSETWSDKGKAVVSITCIDRLSNLREAISKIAN